MNINLANIDFCPGGKSATLTETTAEILLSETEKVIVPPEGTDGFNKVTITHAPVEESVSATITENGTHTITPSEGFGAMVGVNVDVNVSSGTIIDVDGMTYAYSTIKEFPSNFKFAPRTGRNCENMFHSCNKLTSIPQLDTRSVTNMREMFSNCTSLTTIPQLDTHSVTDMSYMFMYCDNLTSIPQLDTSKVTTMGQMFFGCTSLTSIPQLDTSKVTDMFLMFSYCSSLTTLGGFTGLKVDLDLSPCPKLTKESLLNVFNDAADVTASPMTLTLGANLNKLTDEDKAIAANKGWTLK